MASGKSENYIQHLLNQFFTGTTLTFPVGITGSIYLALYSTTPTPTTGGVEVSTSGTNYSRLSIGCNNTEFLQLTGVQTVTSNLVAQAIGPALMDWAGGANITGAGFLDQATGGSLWYFGDLVTPKPILLGDTASFAIGAITATEA